MKRLQLKKILQHWEMEPIKVLSDTLAPGSPERCLERWVILDTGGNRFILERLDANAFDRKTVIVRRLERLSNHDLAVTPYCRQINGQWLLKDNCFCWQIAPFIEGMALDRACYWKDGWRGRAMGQWLIPLAEATVDWNMGAAASEARHPGFIDAFLKTLHESHLFSDDIMSLLPLMTLAVRFGWLSEWLRSDDRGMVDFEPFYMGLIKESCP